MFFEGSEKKIEIVVVGGNLRSLGRAFWEEVISAARAKILSHMYTDQLDAYLLSESSLFVWDDRFTLITCGRTTLIESVFAFARSVDPKKWDLFIFERKNEYRPQLQITSFHDDVRSLQNLVSGSPYRFGSVDAHHLFLFHGDKTYRPHAEDRTLEILMYDLQGSACDTFSKPPHDKFELRKRTGVDKILDGFAIDDFVFDPCGYSLNAIQDDFYFTIHVTPEDNGSYVSFETNFVDSQNTEALIERVIGIFQPRSFDVVGFNCSLPKSVANFQIRSRVEQDLKCGYGVKFQNFEAPLKEKSSAFLLEDLVEK